MHVLFVAPEFPANQKQYVRALHAIGARVTGIGERPASWLDGDLKRWLSGYEQISNVCDEQALFDVVRKLQKQSWVDRLEATIESHIMTAAKVREATSIPGISSRTALLCRDKPMMKDALREANIPCAQSLGTSSPEDARAFAKKVGYPLILKPRAGAGASGTVRVDNDHQLEAAIKGAGLYEGGSVAVEEFIEGHEGFYDTLTVGGEVVHEFISHYYPNVLEAMRERWISPQIVVTNRVDAPGYDSLKAMGREVISAMQIGTAGTHMEWFYGPKGLKFSEIGVRPPGVGQWDLYSAANDLDLYREWAMAICHRRIEGEPSRRYSAGLIALRPDKDGVIAGYEGVDALQSRFGKWVIDAHLPPVGTPTQPVEAGFMANAWVRLRHPDYDTLREMLDTVGRTMKVRAR